jgi:2-oxo-4-hydroxy-4-carboxy--5-ureidoimidazoline (OHCU) decarboxylase
VSEQAGLPGTTTPQRPGHLPPIEVLDRVSAGIFAATVAPLFEGAPRFLGRLANARPFGSMDRLFERARQIAHAMPVAEQLELIDAHPRLGAPPASVSAFSFIEQGYEREAAERAAHDAEIERAQVAAELDRLNAAYEDRFGFRYCVFVAGRSRAALLPGLAAALGADRSAEIARALDAVVDIAIDRYDRSSAIGLPATEVKDR